MAVETGGVGGDEPEEPDEPEDPDEPEVPDELDEPDEPDVLEDPDETDEPAFEPISAPDEPLPPQAATAAQRVASSSSLMGLAPWGRRVITMAWMAWTNVRYVMDLGPGYRGPHGTIATGVNLRVAPLRRRRSATQERRQPSQGDAASACLEGARIQSISMNF